MKKKKLGATFLTLGALVGIVALRNIFIAPTSYIGTEDIMSAGTYIVLPLILSALLVHVGIEKITPT